MAKALLILVLFAAAIFAGMKWWPREYIPVIAFPNAQKEPPKAELSVQTIPESDDIVTEGAPPEDSVPMSPPSQDTQAQQKALEDIANHIAGKGAQIIDKRLFPNVEACQSAMNSVVGEYQRRGIQTTDIVDTSAFVDAPGAKLTAINNMDGYFYLLCIPHPQNYWAGYIQFKLTDEQIRLLNQGASAN